MKENEISILIPTLSRQDILLKTLNFYYNRKVKFIFNICDSTTETSKLFLDRIKYLSKVLNINYFHKINFTDRQAIFFLMEKTETNFATFSGDDDFFIPLSLIKCADFLKRNPDFRVTYGKSIMVDHKSLYNKKNRISASSYWGSISFDENNLIDRLNKLSHNYLVNIFGVHRSKELLEDYKISSTLPSRSLAEVLQNYLTIVRGKAKFLNIPYLIRQVHPSRYLMPKNLSISLVEDNMAEAIPIFINSLSEALFKEGIKKIDAEVLSRDYTKRYLSTCENVQILNSKNNLFFVDIFNKLFFRIFYMFKNRFFRNSKYYRDFLNYLRIIASEN